MDLCIPYFCIMKEYLTGDQSGMGLYYSCQHLSEDPTLARVGRNINDLSCLNLNEGPALYCAKG